MNRLGISEESNHPTSFYDTATGRILPRDVHERFWEKVNKHSECFVRVDGELSECWEWGASINQTGYGRVRGLHGKADKAHRVAWELTYGNIQARCVLHKCDNPLCVRPEHLYVGTQADNGRDIAIRNRSANLKKTHCPRGHEYTPENTLHWSQGKRTAAPHRKNSRRCKLCEIARSLRRRGKL